MLVLFSVLLLKNENKFSINMSKKLKIEKRENIGKGLDSLRKRGILPAVLYGPEIDNTSIQLDLKEFKVLYEEAGETTLIDLEMGDKIYSVLIYEAKKDPLTGEFIHVDFYQPILTEEVEADVPLVFEGESLAVKDLGGTLIKEIQEITVKALPRDLPHEIKVDVSSLNTFDDEILVKDLKVADNVKIQKEADEIVALVTPPQKEEEEEKPVEEGEEGEEGEEKEEVEEEKKDEE